MKYCETCGAESVRPPKYSNKQWAARRFCDRRCAGQRLVVARPCGCGCGAQTPSGCKYIKGHRPKVPTANGYWRVWVGKDHPLARADGNTLEHRLVAFNAGWDLPPDVDVHHKNGDKMDNRLENLEVVRRGEHQRRHAAERGWVRNQYGVWAVNSGWSAARPGAPTTAAEGDSTRDSTHGR